MTIARQVIVTGRVQGVFFRQWTCERARALGVMGWVWNHPDGSVHARLQGSEESVAQLIELMREGSSAAEVEGITVDECALAEVGRFEVRH